MRQAPRTPHRSARWPLILLCAVFCIPAWAQAQTDNPDAIELGPDYAVRATGLSLRPPVGAALTTTGSGTAAEVVISDANHLWQMELSLLLTEEQTPDAGRILDQLIRRLTSTPRPIGERQSVLVNGWPGQRAYFGGVQVSNAEAIAAIQVLSLGPGRYGVLQFLALEPAFQGARPAFDAVAETIDYADPESTEQHQRQLTRRGDQLLRTAIPDVLENLAESSEWFRLFTVSGDGEEREYGYARIRIAPGRRGDITDKPTSQYTDAERAEGVTVQIATRVLPPDGGVADIVSTFFMTNDRQGEDWKIVATHRTDAGQSRTRSIIGNRDGTSAIVRESTDGSNLRPRTLKIRSEGYISQAEIYLLPRILPKADRLAETGFWHVVWSRLDVVFRSDRIEPHESIGGVWTITTSVPSEGGDVLTLVDESGRITSRTTAEGMRWQPITLRRLRDLWREKGLPTD
jgi:hypothetical protein